MRSDVLRINDYKIKIPIKFEKFEGPPTQFQNIQSRLILFVSTFISLIFKYNTYIVLINDTTIITIIIGMFNKELF